MYKSLYIATVVSLFVYSALAIKDNYIFKFKDGVNTTDALNFLEANSKDQRGQRVGQLRHKFDRNVFNGFAGELKSDFLTDFKKKFADVLEYVEEDGIVNATATVTQTGAVWNLARISSKTKGATSYLYNSEAGAGIKVYVLDTGIFASHPEIYPRVESGVNTVNSGSADTTDRNGHGTHCAGIVGSKTYGVAKLVTLVAVKVLDDNGSGSYSSVIAGLDYVATKFVPGKTIVSMSLGGTFSRSLNDVVTKLYKKGVPVFVAAGNSGNDKCNESPASASGAMAVGATNNQDRRSTFSNYGTCVGIYSPGESILSTWTGGLTKTISGTSMACPHLAGVAALFMSKTSITDPSILYKAITTRATYLTADKIKLVYNQ